MKQIFPTDESTIKKVSKSDTQYQDFVNRTNAAEEKAQEAVNAVNNLLANQANAVHTRIISTERVDSSNINNTNKITTNELQSNKITSTDVNSDKAQIGVLNSTSVQNTGNIITDNIDANSGDISNLTSVDIDTHTIHAEEGHINSLSTDTFNPETINTESITSQEGTFDVLTSTDIKANTITGTDIESDTIISEGIESKRIETPVLDVNYITHERDPQDINDLGDYYMLFPVQFTNGFYLVEARNDDGTKLWSVELTNSIKNVQFRWSQRSLGQLIDLKFFEDASGTSIVQIHGHNTEHVTLYRNSITTSNTDPVEIHDQDQLPGAEVALQIVELAGTYIQDVIFTNKLHVNCLEMDALFMDCVGVYRELWLTRDFEQSGEITKPIADCGENGEYVRNTTSCGIVHPSWESPSVRVDSTDDRLIASKTVAEYDGTDYAGTYECEEVIKKYPITNLGDNTVTHGNHCVECNLEVNCNTTTNTLVAGETFNANNEDVVVENGLTNVVFESDKEFEGVRRADYFYCVGPGDMGVGAVYELCDPSSEVYAFGLAPDSGSRYITARIDCYVSTPFGSGWAYTAYYKGEKSVSSSYSDAPDICIATHTTCNPTVSNWSRASTDVNGDLRYDELAVYNCECDWDNNSLIAYNKASNTLQPTDTATLDNLEVNNLKVGCDAYIGRNLYVCGKTITTEEETVSTSSDMIILRQNNETPLATGEASGIIINKYDGTNNLAVVTDKDGVLRIGEVSGTNTTYASIRRNKDGDWYKGNTNEREYPVGELTSWDSKEVDEYGWTIYTNAIFTQFNYSDLSPVLGRDEINDMTNNALLIFNKTTWEANTLTIPSENGTSLKYDTENEVYYWEKSAGVYVFANMGAYNDEAGNIPDGSIVEILNESSYLTIERQ